MRVELVQARLVTDDVAGQAAAQYSVNRRLEKPTVIGPARPLGGAAGSGPAEREVILDFLVGDVDAEYPRITALGAGLVLPPTTQPWGSRSMVFTDPEGNLVNVFSRPGGPA